MSSPVSGARRARRRFTPLAPSLEARQLLSGAPTATMIQTATFPNLEALPNVATQAFLYFSSSMGTLTEVDVVASGSYSTEFSAENLGSSTATIEGTTSGNLAINLPSGAIPVTIPSVSQTYNASPFDGTLNDAGTSGKIFTPVTSSSAPQTTVLTSPADLAAFTGSFRIPITVSGHAEGSASSSNGDMSDTFQTQTSVTLTVIYHYIPNLPSLDPPADPSSPPASGQSSGSATGTSGSPDSSSASSGAVSAIQTASTQTHQSVSHAKKKAPKVVVKTTHKPAQHTSGKLELKPLGHSHAGKKHPK
jgi:hypothetical protein